MNFIDGLLPDSETIQVLKIESVSIVLQFGRTTWEPLVAIRPATCCSISDDRNLAP